MIQSACDPGAPQNVTTQAIRGRVCRIRGTNGVKPAMPATRSSSLRVKSVCDSTMLLGELFLAARLGGRTLCHETRSHIARGARVRLCDVLGEAVHRNLLAAVPAERLARRDVMALHAASACGRSRTGVKRSRC